MIRSREASTAKSVSGTSNASLEGLLLGLGSRREGNLSQSMAVPCRGFTGRPIEAVGGAAVWKKHPSERS